MLDGLDEVADVDLRDQVINAISALASKLSVWKADAQLIVTSRPSTSQRTSILAKAGFNRVALTDLPEELINKYAESWIAVRNFGCEQADEFRDVLQAAMQTPHVADLARNPMQLAILLHLVHVRGWSMPDKRTALYDAYVDTALTREAEKDLVVRQNREILLELHGYIAWLLHARVEDRDSRGSLAGDIERNELIQVFERYLREEERPVELASEILTGVQRFFVLVERGDEGRFEFEVQPLREFFAARHLYMTSPQSPSSVQATGSRPERLEELLRRPYWMNVTRFFCGYFTKGEIPGLARQLEDLTTSSDFGYLLYSYELVERIVRDYSLSASQRDTNETLAVYCRGPGLRVLAHGTQSFGRMPARSRVFDDETGRAVVVRAARERLAEELPEELLQEYSWILRVHDETAADWWWERRPALGSDNEDEKIYSWLRQGILLDAVQSLPLDRALELFSSENLLGDGDWYRVVEAGRADVAEHDPSRLSAVRRALADGPATVGAVRHPDRNWLTLLANQLDPRRWIYLRSYRHDVLNARSDMPPDVWGDCPGYVSELRELSRRLSLTDANAAAPGLWWSEAVSSVKATLGESWAAWRIALIGATLGDSHVDDASESCDIWKMAKRAYAGRNDRTVWHELLADECFARDDRSARRVGLSAALFAWASGDVLVEVLPSIGRWWSKLTSLELAEIRAFQADLAGIRRTVLQRDRKVAYGSIDSAMVGSSALMLAAPRMSASDVRRLVSDVDAREMTSSEASIVSSELLHMGVYQLVRKPSKSALDRLAELYRVARNANESLLAENSRALMTERAWRRFPDELIEAILTTPESFPWDLVNFVHAMAITRRIAHVVPLGAQAAAQGWFVREASR